MTNKIIVSVLGAIGLVTVNAAAGYHQPSPSPVLSVQRDSTTKIVTVKGALGSVHNAKNLNIFIECRIRGYRDIDSDPLASYEAACSYNDGTLPGDGRQCSVRDADVNLLQAILSINGNSQVEFKYLDDSTNPSNNGRCTEITVENNSKFASKTADVLPAFDEPVWGSANGALGSARNSGNTTEQIGCNLYSDGSTFHQVSCSATAADGSTASCSSESRNVVFALNALKSDSHLAFSGGVDGGECNSRVEIINSSKYRPAY